MQPDEEDERKFGTVWVVHLIYLEAISGGHITCSECGRIVFRGPGESDYACICGVTL